MNKTSFVILAIALIAMAWTGVAHGKQEAAQVVRAERYELVDKTGKVLGVLATGGDGQPSIELLSKQGKGQATIGMSPEGDPYMHWRDNHGMLRVLLHASTAPDERGTTFELNDPDAQASAEITVAHGKFTFLMMGKEGRRASIHVPPDGKPTLILQQEKNTRTLKP